MKTTRIAICTVSMLLALFVLSQPVCLASVTYNGSLASDYNSGNSTGADGLIVGTGNWVGGTSPAVLGWQVSYDGSLWHYEYKMDVPPGNVSHLIIETSLNFGLSDLRNVSGGTPYMGSWGPSPGNPYMPGTLYGIKFDGTSGNPLTISFDSPRRPVWGDFYAKNGAVGGGLFSTAWNAGFTDPDPTIPPADGSVAHHLLVPDTVIPAPGAILLGGIGAGLVGWLRRRRTV